MKTQLLAIFRSVDVDAILYLNEGQPVIWALSIPRDGAGKLLASRTVYTFDQFKEMFHVINLATWECRWLHQNLRDHDG